MVKFPEAEARKFHNIFVCRKCKSKIKAPNLKVLAGKVSCRKCGSKILRPVRKK
ncbi:MAG: 50S ribosomal protein L40e [archaeon]